jgi:hypothetical protein
MSGKRLFMGPTPHQFAQASEESATRMMRSFTEDQLLANRLEDLVQTVVDDKVPRPIALGVEHRRIANPVLRPSSETGDGWAAAYRAAPSYPDRELIQGLLYVPYSGTRSAFDQRPNHMPVNMVEGLVTDREVILSVVVEPSTPAAVVEQRLLAQEQHLVEWVNEVNRGIASLEQYIRSVVTCRLQGRLNVIKKRDDMAAAFSIPVREVGPERALDVPVKRTAVVLKATPVPGASGQREWKLDQAIYERMIQTITKFGHALERRPRSAGPLIHDEETIRDWLMFNLSTNYEAPDGSELFIGGEVENGNGKTDILVRHQNRNVFIAECKFWGGPKKFDKAIGQLLSYTTWRDTKAAIILFITNKNATAAIDSAGARLAAHAACKEAPVSAEPYERRDYRFTSPDDNQRVISLALLPVVVRKVQASTTASEV